MIDARGFATESGAKLHTSEYSFCTDRMKEARAWHAAVVAVERQLAQRRSLYAHALHLQLPAPTTAAPDTNKLYTHCLHQFSYG